MHKQHITDFIHKKEQETVIKLPCKERVSPLSWSLVEAAVMWAKA